MNDNVNVENGHVSAFCSLLLGIITWFTPENIEWTLRIIVAAGSILTAIVAVRYYSFAIKEKKLKIKQLKDEKKV